MEKVIDLEEWLKTIEIPVPDFYAIYDLTTGEVTGIYPEHSCQHLSNKIKIDKELADSIFDGTVAMSNCFIDCDSETLEIVQVNNLRKIDDILHRVVDKKYSTSDFNDISIKYKENKLVFELNEKLRNKKTKWAGDTECKFIVTSYNDPHKIYQLISFTLDSLYEKDQVFDYDGPDSNFSVFTNRILKRYVIEKYESN